MPPRAFLRRDHPPPATDSEARKKRDASNRSMDEQIADALDQARRSGELQGAESWGKPMTEMAG